MDLFIETDGLIEKKKGKTTYFENLDGQIKAKQCTCCFETKGIDDFYKRKSGLGGYSARCKVCSNVLSERYHIELHEKLLHKTRKKERIIRYKKYKEQLFL